MLRKPVSVIGDVVAFLTLAIVFGRGAALRPDEFSIAWNDAVGAAGNSPHILSPSAAGLVDVSESSAHAKPTEKHTNTNPKEANTANKKITETKTAGPASQQRTENPETSTESKTTDKESTETKTAGPESKTTDKESTETKTAGPASQQSAEDPEASTAKTTGTESTETNAVGQTSQQRTDDPETLPPGFNKQFLVELMFFICVYCLAGGVFLSLRRANQISSAAKALKAIAVLYQQRPLLMPMLVSGAGFAASELLAQYRAGGCGERPAGWDLGLTFAAGAGSAFFMGWAAVRAYRRLDEKLGEATTLGALFVKACKMEVYVLLCLPVLVALYSTLVYFLYYVAADAWQQCGASALVGAPGNVGTSIALAAPSWIHTIGATAAFWPPAHVVTFVLVQRWLPDSRTSWDGLFAALWNAFLVTQMCAGSKNACQVPCAIGPMISVLPPLPREGRTPAVDCGRWSVAAMTRRFWDAVVAFCRSAWNNFKNICMWCWRKFVDFMSNLWQNLCKFATWCKVHFKAFCWWCYRAFRVVSWYIWYVFCFIVLFVGVVIRISIYIALDIPWKILVAFAAVTDFIKNVMLMWFIPDVTPASTPFAWIWPPDNTFPKHAMGKDAPWPTESLGLSIIMAFIGEVIFIVGGLRLRRNIKVANIRRREAKAKAKAKAEAKAKAKSRFF